MKLLIKGTLTALGDGEFQEDLIYHFKVSPMAQDKNGDDRVFTFILYTKKQQRNSPKDGKERKLIADRKSVV